MARMSDVRPTAIIGAGTIGRAVGAALASGAVPGTPLLGYLVRGNGDGSGLEGRRFSTLAELIDATPDTVVETASHEAVRDYAEIVLAAGIDFVCVSVGALADAELRGRLADACRRSGATLVVPSGAVGGLDLLRAASEADLDEVVIEQRKPARAILGPEEADGLEGPLVVFEGSVAEVVKRFPKSTNVAAAVALAGLGFEATKALVIADPALEANQAILTGRGSFGVLTLRLENVASANPRTSVVAAQSVLAALRRFREPIVF